MRSRPELMRPQHVGDYVLEQRLGMGGMAEVFVARRNGPHGFSKRVAIKRILPQLANDPRLVAMFCDEARIQAALGHPNLVQVFDFGEDNGQPFIALELVEGLSGAELIARVANRRRTVELGPALYIAREVLEALSYVHAATDEQGRSLGIVHRDVAPSNILIGRMGQVKLGDFGIVRSTMIDSRTVPGELKGKVGYVSPEQALGMPLDGRSDLFSLGIVLAELLLCAPLFTGRSEIEVLQSLHSGNLRTLDAQGQHIPADVRLMLMKALSRWPEQRYQTAQEFAHDVESVARTHGESLGAHVLAEWLSDLGLVAISSDVHQRPPPLPVSVHSRPLSSEAPFAESVTLVAGESDLPPASLTDALLQALPRNDIPSELSHAVSEPVSRPTPDAGYRVRTTGGALSGPFRLSRVLEMLATGKLPADAELSRHDGPFLAMGSVFELARLAARPAYRFHEPLALCTEQRWAARLEHLPQLVFDLVRQRKTGLLCARRGREQVRVYFVSGAPHFTSSTDPRDLLGARLVAEGHLSTTALDDALERGWRGGKRVGEALVETGLASVGAVQRALWEQRRRRLVNLLRFRVGELSFVEDAEHGEEVPLVVGRLALVTSAVLEAYADDEIARVLEAVERAGLLEPAPHAEAIQSALELPAAEADALSRARRGRSLRTLMQEGVRAGSFDARAARRATLIGLASGALRWSG